MCRQVNLVVYCVQGKTKDGYLHDAHIINSLTKPHTSIINQG